MLDPIPFQRPILETAATTVFEDLTEYLEVGGYVMPPLFLALLLLWYGIGYRAAVLKRGSRRSVRDLVDGHLAGEAAARRKPRGVLDAAVMRGIPLAQTGRPDLRRRLDDAFADLEAQLARHAILVRSIVAVAPLMGLLGTVVGMIETFDSLGDMALFTQTGGIAGGISQALFTTQVGLAIAIPGMIVERMLDKRQRLLQRELNQVKDILCAQAEAPDPRGTR